MAEAWTQEALIALGRELFEQVTSGDDRALEVAKSRIVNPAHAPVVHGLSRHALRQALAVFTLYEQGFKLEAMPLVRAAYEGAITAQWMADSREGLPAFLNRESELRGTLAETMAKSVSENFRKAAPSVAQRDFEEMESIASNQARYFKNRCLALKNVGHDGYVIFKAMSNYSHPSVLLVDEYVNERPDTQMGIALRDEPEDIQHVTWVFLTAAAMTWAAQAVDVMDKRRPQREYLRGVARRLEVPLELRLTSEALAAETRVAKERRHAGWRGPKPRKRKGTPPDDQE